MYLAALPLFVVAAAAVNSDPFWLTAVTKDGTEISVGLGAANAGANIPPIVIADTEYRTKFAVDE